MNRNGKLRALTERKSRRIAVLLTRAGKVGNPYVLSSKAVSNAVVAAFPFAGAAVALALLVSPLMLLLAAGPLLLFYLPEVRLRDRVSQRREGVERELPFFSILVNVMGSAGVPMYAVFEAVADSRVFPYVREEGLLLRRDVKVFGKDPNDAIESLAAIHPSNRFGSFLAGYASKVRSGGDMPAYLAGESGSLLRELEERWSRYAERAGVVGSMMITVFGLLPLLLMVVGVFSPGTAVEGLLFFTAVGVPTFTVLLVYMAGRMQPVADLAVYGKVKLSVLASAPGLALALVTHQFWVSAAVGVFLFSAVYGLSVRAQMREMKETDDALPEFLKDLLEFRRQEYDLSKSLAAMASKNRYNPTFDKIMARMLIQLKAGVPVDELRHEPKTRLAKMAFLVIGEMARSGGGSVDTVFQVSAYAGKVQEMKRKNQAEMKPYLVLSYVSPVLLAFGVTFVGGILRSFGSGAAAGEAALKLSGMQFGGMPPLMTEATSLLIVVSSAALGLIGAKMVDFTVRNTLRVAVNVTVAVAATYLLTAVGVAGLYRLA